MVATVSCKVKFDNSGLKKVLNACEEFKKTIKVGYINDPELGYKAAQNELGGSGKLDDGSSIEIPPRPFVTHAMDTYGDEIVNSGNSLLENEFTKKAVKEKMESVAKWAKTAIAVSIEDVKEWSNFPHNSPRTVELKGFDKPLVDTGAMKAGIEYEIGG